jgi:hypothetical protein
VALPSPKNPDWQTPIFVKIANEINCRDFLFHPFGTQPAEGPGSEGIVVVHQDPRVGLELRQGAGLGEGFGEKLAVGVVEDDGLTVNATPRSAVGEMRSVAA